MYLFTEQQAGEVLIGHSFGGTTARMFAELMAHGDEEERNAAKDDDLSPLFLGGAEHKIHSVVAVSCALNGNSAFDMLIDPDFDSKSVKVPWWSRYFGRRMSDKLQTETDGRDIRDCGDYDMQIDEASLLNEKMGTLPNVYYYSVPCSYTKKMVKDMFLKKECSPSLLCVHSRSVSIPVLQKAEESV